MLFQVEGGEAAMEEVENMPDTIEGRSYSWTLCDSRRCLSQMTERF